ncbi:MAG: dienelactone hydrolase family protein [Caulobacteraceae bacterium]
MARAEVNIPTPDGEARAYVFEPAGEGPWPPVLFFMDAPAIRPALFEMAERLTKNGYFVLLPDMFWRAGPYEPIDIAKVFQDEAARRVVFGKLMASTDAQKAMSDTAAFLDWIVANPKARPGKVGITGYCMGGRLAIIAAGTFPDRIAAAGAFHPGGLVTDSANSPHLLAPKIKARIYVAGADEDAGFTADNAQTLRHALDQAGVENKVEIYAGAKHGYAPPDMPVYDRAASERHWRELLNLLDETMKSSQAAA